MNSVAWASFSFLSQPFFSMHRLLSCSGKSCALFKLNFARWLVLELFICPKDRGRVGQITAVLPDSLLHACLPFLTAVSCLWWYFNIFSVSLCFSPSSHSAYSPLQWQVTLMNIIYLTKSNQRCIIICLLCSNSGKRVDYTFINGLKKCERQWQHCFKMKIRIKEICTLDTQAGQNTLIGVAMVLLTWWHTPKINDE